MVGSSNPRCDSVGGSCSTSCSGGQFHSGLCNGPSNVRCCVHHNNPSPPSPSPTPGGDCGAYGNSPRFTIKGNGGKSFSVTKVEKNHLSDPSSYDQAPTATDNSILPATACAFNAMHDAAAKAGVQLVINSAFRTIQRQQYFYHCYQCGCCNNGNLAAVPGTSNHGWGLAIDMNMASGVYSWLARNAHNFGFIRTVRTETWHWEHRPGQPRAPYT